MRAFVTILHELWGLFVDDGSLALSLLAWCAVLGVALPKLLPGSDWSAPLLSVGCVICLLISVARASAAARKSG